MSFRQADASVLNLNAGISAVAPDSGRRAGVAGSARSAATVASG